jgi:KDO2-lipid IV(A) lauroyltransferase
MSRISEPAILPLSGSNPAALPAMRRLRYRMEYAGFWCIAKVAALLPLELCADWSAWCWRQLGRFSSRQRRAATQLAQSLPELSEAERTVILTEMWDNLGRVFAETFHLEDIIADRTRYEMTREPELRQLLASRKHFVIVAMHSANWELAGLGPFLAGFRIATVVRAINNPYVDAFVMRLRRPLYPSGLFIKSQDTPRRFIKLMRKGVNVAMMSDLRQASGVEVPFFGRPAPSTSFPALLAVAHDVPILAVRTERLPRSHFRFVWRVLEPIRDGASREDNVQATTALIQNCFENWVRERPGEWLWVHRRWA